MSLKFKVQSSKRGSFFLLFSFLLFSFSPCFGQNENPPPPQSMQKEAPTAKSKPKIVVGGGFGVQFGNFGSAVGISPQVGVYIKPWLLVLASGQYTYMWRKSFYDSHIWGVGVALQPCIIKRIIIHAGYEFEQNNFRWLDGSPKQVYNFHFAVLGGGYKQYLAPRVFIQALVLFNIPITQPTINNYSHNYYPFFRVGVGVDL